MVRFKKGSKAAKDYMKKLRAKRRGVTLTRKKIPYSSKKRVSKTRGTPIKYKRRTRPMAKRKRTAVRRKSSKGMFGALQKPIVAGLTYAIIQPILSQVLYSKFNIGIQDELVQILGAVVIRNVVRNPIVNNFADAAIIINTASLVGGLNIGNIFGGAAQTTNANSGIVVIG